MEEDMGRDVRDFQVSVTEWTKLRPDGVRTI
jgi:hypothetical protein